MYNRTKTVCISMRDASYLNYLHDKYISLNITSNEENILRELWKDNKEKFPAKYKVVRQYQRGLTFFIDIEYELTENDIMLEELEKEINAKSI